MADKDEELERNDEFLEGDLVEKIGGDYDFVGYVVSKFTKRSGQVRYVVEDDRGVLHIYNNKHLQHKIPEPEPTEPMVMGSRISAHILDEMMTMIRSIDDRVRRIEPPKHRHVGGGDGE